MKRFPEGQHPNLRNRSEDQPETRTDEYDIDRILAESFPASDAPPWTLGVEHPSVEDAEASRKRRRNRS